MRPSGTFLFSFGLVLSCSMLIAKRIIFDFHLTRDMKTADFDNPDSALSKEIKFVVKGQKQKRSEVLSINPRGQLVELGIQINNDSIFVPGDDPKNTQYGFRRTDVLPKIDPATALVGTTVFHTSFRTNPELPLNLKHFYLFSSIEIPSGDHVFDIGAGFDFSSKMPVPTAKNPTIRVRNLKTDTLYSAPLKDNTLYNFAVAVDWKANTLTVYASEGDENLKKVAGPAMNDPKVIASENVQKGEWHIQLIKFPLPDRADTVAQRDDVPHHGIQEGTREGCFFSRMFVESGTNGQITESVTRSKST